MYSTKRVNKNTIEGSKYITIGDPYVDKNRTLPTRWKAKQFNVPAQPSNAQSGYFGKFQYGGDKYLEMEAFSKTQPLEKRKLGFGTHDASRRGEFTASIRTEQYRETLKKESVVHEKHRDRTREEESLQRWQEQEQQRTFPAGLRETKHLFDIGRELETPFDPRSKRDTFYTMKKDSDKRMGGYKTMSQDIGEGAWQYKYEKPQFGPVSHVKNFDDKSHLSVEGF